MGRPLLDGWRVLLADFMKATGQGSHSTRPEKGSGGCKVMDKATTHFSGLLVVRRGGQAG